jgi:hypothetical protein
MQTGDRAMTRLFAILALTGALTIPDPSFARPSFRPAFTTGPFRIVLPAGRPHVAGAPRIHATSRTARRNAPHPVVRAAAAGPAPFRMHRHFRGSVYPVTVGADGSYYGAPYDPSDIPVYAPLASTDDPAVLALPPRYPVASDEHGCRAQRVLVPRATGAGESEVTIVRC